ncbi:MAG: serine protease [Kiritimatiellia bacterium]
MSASGSIPRLLAVLAGCAVLVSPAQSQPRPFSEAWHDLTDALSKGTRASVFQKRNESPDSAGGSAAARPRTNAWHRPLFSLSSMTSRRSDRTPAGVPNAFESAKDKLAVIVAGDRTGTGFLLRDGARTFLFTNLHIVKDAPFVTATRLNGQDIRLGARDYARNRDMARFEVIGDYPFFLIEPDIPDIGEPIVILGNSDGRGVVTELRGRILGVGPSEIEVDAKFVTGNSGSPVINREGKVVGIASYLKDCRNAADWSKTGTRFNGIRRFALRPRGILWYRPRLDAGGAPVPPVRSSRQREREDRAAARAGGDGQFALQVARERP